jgi:outer membrane protein TolC
MRRPQFEAHLRQAKVFFEAGTQVPLRRDQGGSGPEQCQAGADLRGKRRDAARLSMNQVMGIPPPPSYRNRGQPAFQRYRSSLTKRCPGPGSRSDLKSLAAQLEAADREIDLARKSISPASAERPAFL